MGRGALQYLVSKTEPNRRSTLRTRHEKNRQNACSWCMATDRSAYPRIAVHIHGSLALGHRIRDRATTGWRVSMSMQTLVSESRAEQSRADINSSNLRRLRIQYPCLAQTRASPWATRPEASEEAGTRAGIPYCISAVPHRTQLLYSLAAAVAAIVACDVCVWLECE